MSESIRVPDVPAGDRRLSRRLFVRGLSLFGLAALAGPALSQARGLDQAAPAAGPAAMSVWEALKNRRSATGFTTQPVPPERLLDLLWAAFGINRPNSGKRTAPSAMNSQEIDIYVLLAGGAYVYDPKDSQLVPVASGDFRSMAARQQYMQGAPVHLLYVADYARLRGASQSQKELYSAVHSGFIGQNVYLYCAAEGLGTRFHTSIDRAALKDRLKLRDDQGIVFAQVVGYPGK